MEASETEQADPFAEESGSDPFAEEEAPAVEREEPPVVDREGQPVGEPSEAGKRMAAEAAAKAEAATDEPETATEGGQEPPQEPPAAPPTPAEHPAGAQSPAGAQGGGQTAQRAARGDGARRHYKLLYQTDKGQWTEAPLSQWAESEYVTIEDGEHWIVASNADQVRRVGYVLFQRPADGVTLLPVARGAWKPVRVRAKQVPTRERLEFESA